MISNSSNDSPHMIAISFRNPNISWKLSEFYNIIVLLLLAWSLVHIPPHTPLNIVSGYSNATSFERRISSSLSLVVWVCTNAMSDVISIFLVILLHFEYPNTRQVTVSLSPFT